MKISHEIFGEAVSIEGVLWVAIQDTLVRPLLRGFIFDIDGCLTLPGYDTSVLDVHLMDRIHDLSSDGIPVLLVTGRSDGWLKKHYAANNRLNYLHLTTYIEFGLVWLDKGTPNFVDEAHAFQALRADLLEMMADTAEQHSIYFEKDKAYDDYPDHGSMWLEDKHIQISIAAHKKVESTTVHQLAARAWASHTDKIRVLNHHLGVDVIPKDWSKAKATEHYLQTRDLDQSQYRWMVFGDNTSDREMCRGLDNVHFVDTKASASHTVREVLDRVLS